MSKDAIVIAAATRTAVGSFNGSIADVCTHDLGAIVIKDVLMRVQVSGEEVDEAIMGQIFAAGQGQNPARKAAINAGIPDDKTIWCLNHVYGSRLRSVAVGMQ